MNLRSKNGYTTSLTLGARSTLRGLIFSLVVPLYPSPFTDPLLFTSSALDIDEVPEGCDNLPIGTDILMVLSSIHSHVDDRLRDCLLRRTVHDRNEDT